MESSVLGVSFLIAFGTMLNPSFGLAEVQHTRQPFSLNQVETIKPGHTTRSVIEKTFGAPDKEYLEPGNDGRVAWLYFEQPFSAMPRVSFLYKPNSDIVHSVTWQPREGEPEQDLVKTEARFKSAHFQRREAEWITPHASPDEFLYEDLHSGISIRYQKSAKRIETISWIDPAGLLAIRVPNSAKKKVQNSSERVK